MKQQSSKPKDNREGIALILVLGILTGLLLMAVGFATFLRTERIVASSYVDNVKTRQLGLAALDTLVQKLKGDPPEGFSWGVYPPFDVYTIPQANRDFDYLGGVCSNLLFGSSRDGGTLYFVNKEAQIATGVVSGNSAQRNDWMDAPWCAIYDQTNGLMGRYSYVLVNESGRIDLNHAGADPYPTDGGTRQTARDLYLTEFDNINGAANLRRLISDRDTQYGQYYTPPEMRFNNVDVFNSGGGGSATYPNDDHFTFYQRYRQPDLNVGTDNLTSNENDFVEAFESISGINNEMARQLFTTAGDYVDEDLIPGGSGAGQHLAYCSEPFPMFNEIAVKHSVVADPNDSSNKVLRTEISLELWYPFYTTNTLSETLPLFDNWTVVLGGRYTNTLASTIRQSSNLSGFTLENGRFFTIAFPASDSPGIPMGDRMSEQSKLSVALRLTDNRRNVVDSAGFGNPPFIEIPIQNSVDAVGDEATTSFCVNDPRINWDRDDWVQASETLGQVNDGSVYTPGSGAQDERHVFIRNGPMQNVGELGYLGLFDPGNPDQSAWKSVDMAGTHREAWDLFTVHSNRYEHGLVNINASNINVLASALYKASIETYPGEANTGLNWSQAQELAEEMVRVRGNNPFNSFADMVQRVSAFSQNAALNGAVNGLPASATIDNENKRESLLREVVDMMDYRGNSYSFVLRVQGLTIPPGATGADPYYVLGELDLVGQIWVDPIKGDARVPYIKWVTHNFVHESL